MVPMDWATADGKLGSTQKRRSGEESSTPTTTRSARLCVWRAGVFTYALPVA